jgi:hypothetical protein
MFFFEKKNQKTFVIAARMKCRAPRQTAKEHA